MLEIDREPACRVRLGGLFYLAQRHTKGNAMSKIRVKQLVVGMVETNCYIIYNEETKEGTLVERQTYNYGDIITFPQAEKEETEEIKYVLDSWKNLGTEEVSPTEINIRFKAEYREEYYVEE